MVYNKEMANLARQTIKLLHHLQIALEHLLNSPV